MDKGLAEVESVLLKWLYVNSGGSKAWCDVDSRQLLPDLAHGIDGLVHRGFILQHTSKSATSFRLSLTDAGLAAASEAMSKDQPQS